MRTKPIIISSILVLSFVFAGTIWFLKPNHTEDIDNTHPVSIKSETNKDLISSDGVQRNTSITNTPRTASSTTDTPQLSPSTAADDVVRRFESIEEYESASKYGKLPDSLSGVHVAWDLNIDDEGKLIVAEDMRDFFEFFLSAHTEEGFETSLGRIEEYINFVLPNAAANEALDIFYAYVDYKMTLTRFQPSEDRILTGDKKTDLIATIRDVKNALNERSDSRRQHLGTDVADALFNDREATAIDTIRRLEIETDDSLSEDEKEEMLAELPPHVREFYVRKKINALREEGGDGEKIYAMRADLYGEEAADSLKGADQAEAEWDLRLQKYNETKEKLLSRSDLTDEEKKSMVEDIEGEFSEEELLEIRFREKNSPSRTGDTDS